MGAPGKGLQRLGRLVEIFGLADNLAADGDDGIGGKHESACKMGFALQPLLRDNRLRTRNPLRVGRGCSPFRGVSSMDAGRRASGSMPICSRSERRREEALASTRSFCVLDRTAEEPRSSSGFEGRRATILLEAISDASFGKIIGRHLD